MAFSTTTRSRAALSGDRLDAVAARLTGEPRKKHASSAGERERIGVERLVVRGIERGELTRSPALGRHAPDRAVAHEEDVLRPPRQVDPADEVATGRERGEPPVGERDAAHGRGVADDRDARAVGREHTAAGGAGEVDGAGSVETPDEEAALAVLEADHSDRRAVGCYSDAALPAPHRLDTRRERDVEVNDRLCGGGAGSRLRQRPSRECEGTRRDRPRERPREPRARGAGCRRAGLVGEGLLVQREPRFADVPQPAPRVALEAARKQPPHRKGRRVRQAVKADGLLDHRGQDVRDRLAVEELLAGEHLEEHDPESPDVGAPVDGLPARLLGRHVGGRAEDQARLGARVRERGRLREVARRARRRVAGPGLGEAEVEHLDLAARRQLDVRGLEVAVDDPLLVGFLERLGHLPRDRERLVHGDRPALQPRREVLALDELHHQDGDPRRVFERRGLEAVEVRDARVVERGEELRLAIEAGEPFGVGREGARQELERDVAAELRVPGAVDLAHAACAERGDDHVVVDAGPDREGQAAADSTALHCGARAARGIMCECVAALRATASP